MKKLVPIGARILRTAIAVTGLLLAVAQAHAAGIFVGSFCIQGVTVVAVPQGNITTADGTWKLYKYSYDAPAAGVGPGKVVFFTKSVVTDDTTPPNCANAKVEAAAQHIPVVLEGGLRHLAVTLYKVEKPGANSFVIDPQGMSLTIGNVTSGFSRIGGGTLSLAGSRAWIQNVDRISIASGGMSGKMRIESWDRTLQAAHVRLPGGGALQQSLHAAPGTNSVIDLDTSTGLASLWRVDMLSVPFDLSRQALEGEMIAIQDPQVRVGTMRLKVTDGIGQLELSDAKGKMAGGRIGGTRFTATVGASDIDWASGAAPATVSVDQIDTAKLAFTGLTLRSNAVTAQLDNADLLKGRATASFAKLGSTQVDGTADFIAPSAPALAFSLPANALTKARLAVIGTPAALTVSGSLNTAKLLLGSMEFDTPVAMNFHKDPTATAIRIPIEVHLGAKSGQFQVANADYSAALRGTLERFNLSANLNIDTGDTTKSYLDVDPVKFSFGVSALVAVTPIIADAKPTFAQLGVEVANPVRLVLGITQRQGNVEISTPTFVIGNPSLKIGMDGKQARIDASLDAKGSVTLKYDLAALKMSLVEGSFLLRKFKIASPDPGFVADFGSVLVAQPSIILDQLAMAIKRGADHGTIAADGLTVAASEVTSKGKGFSYHGAIAAPFTIQSANGSFTMDDAIKLSQLSIKKVGFAVSNAAVDTGDGFAVEDASIAINVDAVNADMSIKTGSPYSLDNFQLRGGGTLHLSGPFKLTNKPMVSNLTLTLNGPLDALNGGGGADLSPFGGITTADMPIGFECDGGGSLTVPVTATLAVGPSHISATLTNGSPLASGHVVGLGADLVYVGNRTCLSPGRNYHRAPVYGSMKGLCPTWRKPFRTCTWKTIIVPEVSVDYQMRMRILGLHAGLVMTNPEINFVGGHQKICSLAGKPVQLVAPMIAATYVPQPAGKSVFDQVLNGLVEVEAFSTETLTANALLNFVGTTVNTTGTLGVTTYCLIGG